jgi:hypothetical protein
VNLACFSAQSLDGQLWLIYQALGGSSGGVSVIDVDAPTSLSDFSMFPGGVIPASGIYQALDDNWLYTLDPANDTTWQQTPRSD